MIIVLTLHPLEEDTVEKTEFAGIRRRLKKTQRELAGLLGTSLKAIHSYEQGWRKVPVHAERQLLFLFSRVQEQGLSRKTCWSIKKCPRSDRERCPAWEFRAGKLCWFINGTICEGTIQKDWSEKMKICHSCEVFTGLMNLGVKPEA
jgi:DNA-binding transcriptional regulator YiaG